MNRRQALTGLLAASLACDGKKATHRAAEDGDAREGRKEPSTEPSSSMVAATRELPKTFDCPRCKRAHKYGEPGFNWPDAAFALSLSEEEKATIRAPGDNEDIATVRGTHFVRGVLHIPVTEWSAPIGLGFWIRISAGDFADFERLNRADHRVYSGHLANQTNFLGPTLGLRAAMSFRRRGERPVLKLLESSQPLAQAQANGAAEALARQWMSETVHQGEPEPLGPAKAPSLEKDGYRLLTAKEAGKTSVQLAQPPSVGSFAKVIVEFLGSDDKGEPQRMTAGWWLKLDETGADDRFSGTLDNVPRVPATVVLGTRFWVRAEHITELKEV